MINAISIYYIQSLFGMIVVSSGTDCVQNEGIFLVDWFQAAS